MVHNFIPNLSPLTYSLFETSDDGETLLIKDICDCIKWRSPLPQRFYEIGGAENHLGPNAKKALGCALEEQVVEMEAFHLGGSEAQIITRIGCGKYQIL